MTNDKNYGEIIKIRQEDFDLYSFVKYIRTVSEDNVPEEEIPTLLE